MISPISSSFDFRLTSESKWLSPTKIAESMYAALSTGLSSPLPFLKDLINFAGPFPTFENNRAD
ncbi:hypothetical protein D9M68_694540 [compost metagenome]